MRGGAIRRVKSVYGYFIRHKYIFLIFMVLLVIVGLVVGLVLGLASGTSASSLPRSGIVDLGYSQYQGLSLHNGIDEFLGIRYARPPVGEFRFRAPQDPLKTNEVLDASSVRFPFNPKLKPSHYGGPERVLLT